MMTRIEVNCQTGEQKIIDLTQAEIDEILANQPLPPTLIEKRAAMPPLSAYQVRKVLIQFGLRDTVESAILNADLATKDAWQYANEFARDNPVLTGMAQSLGMTDEQLDQMFALGVTL